MGLRLYYDPECTNEITNENPDSIRKPTIFGETLVTELEIYIKSDDITLIYENISFTALNDDAQVDVKYALDKEGTPGEYHDELQLPDGVYHDPIRVWRKISAPDVTAAFRRTDIQHSLNWDEYLL